MSDRITVVFCKIAYDTLGGGSQMLLRLVDGLDKSTYEPILLTQKHDVVAEKAEEIGVSVEIVPYRGALDTYDGGLLDGSLITKSAAFFRILQFNIEVRPILERADVIWFDGIRSYTTLLPYIMLRDPTTIWNIGLLQESDGALKWLHELALRTTDYAFIESQKQAESNLTERQFRKYQGKLKIFHKGIDTDRFAPDPNRNRSNSGEPFRIGTAALIHPRKNIDVLINAFALLDHENIELHIAGEPTRKSGEEYLNQLQKQVEDHGIEPSVTFHGWVDDIQSYYNTLDVFVLPSSNEGIPGAVREAMAMKLPVIVTDVGGTSDLVTHGKEGYVIETDETQELAKKLQIFIDNESKREQMAERSRDKIVAEFSLENYISSYQEFINDTLDK